MSATTSDSDDDESKTAFFEAVTRGNSQTIQELLDSGKISDVNTTNAFGDTALHVAARKGHSEVLEVLLAHPRINVNAKVWDGTTPLHWAVIKGYEDIVDQLLLARYGVNVNAQDSKGDTPLHWAAIKGYDEVVEHLLQVDGIDVNINNEEGETPLYLAARNEHGEVVQELLQVDDINVSSEDVHIILFGVVATDGNINVLRLLLQRRVPNIDFNATDDFGSTALHVAAINGHADLVFVLLAKGANVNIADRNGWAPLHKAARDDHDEVVEHLLAMPGIDVNIQTLNGNTPLHVASRFERVEVVQQLLTHPRINVNIQNDNRRTALSGALYWKEHVTSRLVQVVKLLLAHRGVDTGIADIHGNTPLHLAFDIEGGDTIFWMLIEHSTAADINATNDLEFTPFDVAAANGRQFMLELLFEADRRGNVNVLRSLLRADPPVIDVHSTDSEGNTLLHLAARGGHERVINQLIRNSDVDLDVKNDESLTALNLAARQMSTTQLDDETKGKYKRIVSTLLEETAPQAADDMNKLTGILPVRQRVRQ